MFSFNVKALTVPSTYDFTIYKQLLDSFLTSGVRVQEFVSDYVGLFPDKEFSILHTTTPNIKMYYPEPFIASPTFINDDIWFLHITIYQYWLWFIFISLIVFFFLGFLITLRWCNIRHRPARETRGVSRSKCGDLITATVPVSWAASIIIHESTDAIEFADGFGSTDVAIGIRAYQWGWEYYYPKGLDLSNELTGSVFIGNSLTNSSGLVEDTTTIFKSASMTSDFLHPTTAAHSSNLLSLTADGANSGLVDFNFGSNRLIARQATTLLDSGATVSLDSVLDLSGAVDTGLDAFSYAFTNHVWSQSFPEKPLYTNHQLSFFNSKSAFLNAMNFLNWGDWRNLAAALTLTPCTAAVPGLQSTAPSLFSDFLTNLTPLHTTRLLWKLCSATYANFNLTNSPLWPTSLVADQDFKRWSALDLVEDLVWAPADWAAAGFFETEPLLLSVDNATRLEYTTVSPFVDVSLVEYLDSFTLTQPHSLFSLTSLPSTRLLHTTTTAWLEEGIRTWVFSLWKQTQLALGNSTLMGVFSLAPLRSSVTLTETLLNFNDVLGYANLKFSVLTSHTLDDNLDILALWRSFVTHQTAFWKVFKPMLDEQRGTFFNQNFSNTAPVLPVLGTTTSLLGQVQKNSDNVFVNVLSLRSALTTRTLFSTILAYNAVPTFPFPFSLSFESDSIRYSWFDWYSVRNSIITKALDTSVFNLHASRDYTFSFNSSLISSSLVNQYENYFLKYSVARKYYLPSSTYRPFFLDLLTSSAGSGSVNSPNLLYFDNYFRYLGLTNPATSTSPLPIYSGTLTQLRPFTESLSYNHNSVNPLVSFFDVTARREYLLHALNGSYNHGNLGDLSNTLKALNDAAHCATTTNTPLNTYYSTPSQPSTDAMPQVSQYQPLKKGIVNMIRIQADKAVAMPTDTRLQILAVSKDIIHSWAIPAAGIKIDCIPGYSSHRVAIFTLSGIYWGQCMEICGRFHHWMPIVVYFLRRDLFCLWCIHFIFKNNQTNSTLQSLAHGATDSSVVVPKTPDVWGYTC
uniref:cytochrome c oxidase subunit 2 n=1 Tax=Euplotes cristatus TaxID=756077 RepID=UPI002E76D911|nr:cytochrome c oxidase subunit 2 [Euplotes cristatus]UPM52056.1 cytochrome c oxidase subunit 2 [Euplotes cristatus]